MTVKQNIIRMSDSQVDKLVKLQGTKFDRKRTVSPAMVQKMIYLSECGLSTNRIAAECGVSWITAKYHTDLEWRENYNRTRNGKHYGKYSDKSERAEYKRRLLKANARVIYPMA